MPVCPVCEHVQERGDACDVCGKRLAGPGVAAEPVPALEGLEPTVIDLPLALDPDPLPELEPTRAAAPPVNLAEGTAEWIEPTRAGAVGDVAVEPVLDLEQLARASAASPRAPVACRYCRTPAAPGESFCSRCGMRLVVRARGGAETPPAPRRRCRSCGAFGTDDRCGACGGRLPDAG